MINIIICVILGMLSAPAGCSEANSIIQMNEPKAEKQKVDYVALDANDIISSVHIQGLIEKYRIKGNWTWIGNDVFFPNKESRTHLYLLLKKQAPRTVFGYKVSSQSHIDKSLKYCVVSFADASGISAVLIDGLEVGRDIESKLLEQNNDIKQAQRLEWCRIFHLNALGNNVISYDIYITMPRERVHVQCLEGKRVYILGNTRRP